MLQIGDQPARRREPRARPGAEAVERRDLEQPLQPRLAGLAVELAARAQRRRRPGVRARVRGDHLRPDEPGEFGAEPGRAGVDHHEAPGRRGGGGDGDGVPRFADRRAPIVAARVEQRLLRQRAGSDDADDRAGDQRLRPARLARRLGAFGLLGDGDAVAGADEPLEIGRRGMDGDAAHRHLAAVMLAARGQRDVEAGAGDPRIVEEQLEEVAHPVEQQAVARLGLERMILRHHRGGGGVGHASGR